MAYLVETFTAYDEQSKPYQVDVHHVAHRHLSGSAGARDYSLAETGEVLERVQDKPLVLKIRSTDTLVVDVRGVPDSPT